MTPNPENIALHLTSFGYTAKVGTINDKATGQPQDVVFINGLGQINAYLNLSADPAKFGLKVFGNLQPGYAPVLLDANGEVIREAVDQDGETVYRAKRGEPLDAAALKRKNDEISRTARERITGPVLAAYMLEIGGGDLELIRDGFRLKKWERTGARNTAEADEIEGAGDANATAAFAQAATSSPSSQSTRKRAQGPSHP